jgi:nucleoside phosphorylase
MAVSPPATADFVIMTALEEERDALHALLPGLWRVSPGEEDTRVYYRADLPVTFPGGEVGTYRIATLSLAQMGQVNAATAAADAIRRWRPRYFLLVGIAGGVSQQGVALGDVLISDQVVDYELQKLRPDRAEVRYQVHRADQRLLEAASNYSDLGWMDSIRGDRPREGRPTRRVGPIATGNKVDAAGTFLRYRDDWPKMIGIEMESGGAANAAFQSAIRPGFFMIRGVSDLADPDKDSTSVGRWRQYACKAAAAYAVSLLRSGPVPIDRADRSPRLGSLSLLLLATAIAASAGLGTYAMDRKPGAHSMSVTVPTAECEAYILGNGWLFALTWKGGVPPGSLLHFELFRCGSEGTPLYEKRLETETPGYKEFTASLAPPKPGENWCYRLVVKSPNGDVPGPSIRLDLGQGQSG